jgi:hypothetical protein
MVDWLWNNRQWVFDGVGIAIIGGAIAWFRSRRKSPSGAHQSQHSGTHSTNIQAGGDIKIGGDAGKHGG